MSLTKTLTASPEVLDVIRQMEFQDTAQGVVGKLPAIQLDRALYTAVNKFLEAASGKWTKKLGGHLFEFDPREKIAELTDSGKLVVKKDGYFPTPPAVVELMIQSAHLEKWHIVLEPSAGVGHIADLVRPLVREVYVIELDKQRRDTLAGKGYKFVGENFLHFTTANVYDRIIMNPPFEDGQDVEHVEHAFDLLPTDGICVAIMSEGIEFRQDSKYKNFRDDILSHYGYSAKLPKASFKDSGTMVNARLVVLKK